MGKVKISTFNFFVKGIDCHSHCLFLQWSVLSALSIEILSKYIMKYKLLYIASLHYWYEWQFITTAAAAAAAKSLQSCPTLFGPIDRSPPGSTVPGILQARIWKWVAISFCNACMRAKSLRSCPTLCNPMDSSPPGSSIHRILQTRILEWVGLFRLSIFSLFRFGRLYVSKNVHICYRFSSLLVHNCSY